MINKKCVTFWFRKQTQTQAVTADVYAAAERHHVPRQLDTGGRGSPLLKNYLLLSNRHIQ